MASVNRVMMMGRLTRDPSLRRLGETLEVAEFGLAMSEWTGNKDGERKEKVCFVDIVVWDRQAAACNEHLRKGMQVFVEGKLQMDEWADKQSGEKRTRLRVRADRVHFLGAPRAAPTAADRDRGAEEGAPAERPVERVPERAAPARGRSGFRAASAA